jgi:periplasmic mercuric ion binding protein
LNNNKIITISGLRKGSENVNFELLKKRHKMKNILTIFGLMIVLCFGAKAQDLAKNEGVVKIKTSAICKMCKARIEKDMSLTKGVEKAELNLDDKVLTLKYNSKKTDAATLKTALSKIGYDADDLVADTKAHDRLPDCCQKTAKPHVD